MAALAMAGSLSVCQLPDDGGVALQIAIASNAARFGLPPAWVSSVMAVESGARPCRKGRTIRSSAGATGVMQLMPSAWRDMRRRFGIEGEIDEPGANIAAGVAYLRTLYERFGFRGAIAAYNAGPQRYEQSLRGRPLPTETEHYVEAVLARIAQSTRQHPDPAVGSVLASLFVIARPVGRGYRGGGLVSTDDGSETLFVLRR